MQKSVLTSGYKISRIIKGGWQLAGGHGTVNKQQAIDDMFAFVEAGITTFDCADIYTGVEELIGEFRKKYQKKYGTRQLSQIKIHTKFVPDLDSLATITQHDVEKTIDRSLKRLNKDIIDLVQFHWWDYAIPRYVEVARYLSDLQKKGKIQHIGVTNFNVPRLNEIVKSGVKVLSMQTQYSVLDHRPENGMVDFCGQNDIKLLDYGTVAGGFLSEKYLNKPEPRKPLENRSLIKYKLIIDDFGGWNLFQELLQTLKHIADKHQVSITNVTTRYVLEKPQVAGVIIGARNANHIDDNLKVFDFSLDNEDLQSIQHVISKSKGPQGDTYSLERLKGGIHARIMKYNLNKK